MCNEAIITHDESGRIHFQWSGINSVNIPNGENGFFLSELSAKMYAAKCNPKLFAGKKCKWVKKPYN
jgi:hypothetical protein